MNSYHFDLGNSSTGPVGFCARVIAASPEEALEKLKASLPEAQEVWLDGHNPPSGAIIEYVTVYLNPDALTVADIDTVEEVIGARA